MSRKQLMGRWLFVSAAQLIICSTAYPSAGLYDLPTLALRPYSTLEFPPQLPRSEVQWMIQRSVDELDQKAFSDLGDISDFMHMHVLLKPDDLEAEPEKSVVGVGWTPPWEKLTAVGALLHTQEYEGARARRPYLDRKGRVIPPSLRNQFLWLRDSPQGRRGEIVLANTLVKTHKNAYTIRSDNLTEIAGPHAYDWEYSFYFFRVHCPDVDALRAQGAKVEESNVIEVRLGGVRACLNLVHFHCRNYPDDHSFCAESANLRPYYSPLGPIAY